MITALDKKAPLGLLIYDDDQDILNFVEVLANEIGFDVLTAATFSEFEQKYHCDVSIIIINLLMPDKDGIEVLRHLAEIDSQSGIILTSSEHETLLKSGGRLANSLLLRFMGYLLKPYNKNVMTQLLSQTIPEIDTRTKHNFIELNRNAVRRCIAKDEITIFYQPKIDIESLEFVSVEALVRWQHPEFGILGSNSFLPLVEELDMIGTMTTLIMEKAFTQLKEWETIDLKPQIAVNLSARSFTDLELPEQFVSIAKKHAVPIERITLEITESWDTKNLARTLDIMTRLRLKGFKLSIDDFGTGYSSMTQLKEMPFTELKLDQSFVRGAENDEQARAIVESCIDLGHKLGLHVVAEGIEKQSDWELVSDLGCDEVQGYFIARPMPGKNIPQWLERWNHSLGIGVTSVKLAK